MDNILSFEEYNDFSLSEGLFTIDFITLLMEEEHRLGLDCIDEGFTFSQKGSGFVAGEHDNEMTDTRIFSDKDKKFKYHIQRLEKSGIDSINLYKFGDIRISKLLKHPGEFKSGMFTNGKKMEINERSINAFMKRSAMYIRSIIRQLDFDIDIITYPKSSSHFNELLTKYVMEGYSDIDSIKVIPELLNKSVSTVTVNRDRAKELGMTDDEIDKLEHKINSWKKQYEHIYPLRLELDQLCDTLMSYRAGFVGKRGRRPNDYFECIKQIEQKKQEIKDAKKLIGMSKGKEKFVKYVDVEGNGEKIARARGFEIKSLDDKTRKAIENLFTLNDELNIHKTSTGETIWTGPVEDRIKNKNIVIFDDNISSGATLDDMCLTLLKHGAKKVLPITMAIIPPTVYGRHDNTEFKNRKGGIDEKDKDEKSED